jgi:DNA-directed RNA polymerase specialized sigma24 family protein
MAVRRPAARVSRESASVRPEEQERFLVEAAKKDPARFTELYELNFERVYAFIMRRVGDRDAAEDLDPGAEPNLEAIEQRAQLFRLVDRLPADQRHVIFERFVEQKSIREVAQRLRRSEGAVKQLQFRALEKLRQQMEGAHA